MSEPVIPPADDGAAPFAANAKVRVNPPIVGARMPQDRRSPPKQAALEKCKSYISCVVDNSQSHMERTMRQQFTVTACGTADEAQPYEMVVVVDDRGITLDGLRLSWNNVRCAIECHLDYAKKQRALFGGRT